MHRFTGCSSLTSQRPADSQFDVLSQTSENWVYSVWYGNSPFRWLLLPLSGLFWLLVTGRRLLFTSRLRKSEAVAAPVVVVGNITAGGTGKTPVTSWLARALRERGYVPGVVSRGYGGAVGPRPVQALAASDPREVGDEAILLAAQSGCPVVVHPDRIAAAEMVIGLGANVVIADDGLQHYRLARNFEIAVVDGARCFGNGYLLPAGPLREPVSRLRTVDQVIVQRHAGSGQDGACGLPERSTIDFHLRITAVSRLDRSIVCQIDEFAGQTVHAVAGIGHPERFFRMLERHGLKVVRHPLPDHAIIGRDDIEFADELAVLMTEKDAVKCRWPDTGKCWFVPVEVEFAGNGGELLLEQILSALGPGGWRPA